MKKCSLFAENFSSKSGILSLMDDLGNALAEGNMIMMGGGNPGHIPEIQDVIKSRLQEISNDRELLKKLIGIYDPPRGDGDFLQALSEMLNREFGWKTTKENICLANGSQSSFFYLFNIFAGDFGAGEKKKILFPLAPEYIGYADIGLSEDQFVSVKPRIDILDNNFFKYRVDFENLKITEDIGAICVSRPTNPTGNVLTNDEIERLSQIAIDNDIPFIIDNAYGVPFPGIVFTDAKPVWDGENIINCMSLSKFGLPATRTGIVVAKSDIIELVSGINSILSLTPSSFGAILTTEIIKSGEIINLSQNVVKPFYKNKLKSALEGIDKYFNNFTYRVHKPEGAMFLWLWFKNLPITSRELYQRLKRRKVLVVSGDYFFPGLSSHWQHTQECIRITYSQDENDVQRGLRIIGEEVEKLYAQ